MTRFVSESSKSVLAGIGKMKSAMIDDYKLSFPLVSRTSFPAKSDITVKMNEKYANSFEVKYGSKYIKIVSNNSVTAFIVGTDKDKKFKRGDILMAAGYNAPARNKARGNLLDGNYPIQWTGPLYLR